MIVYGLMEKVESSKLTIKTPEQHHCGGQPLKNLKRYDLLKQTLSIQSF